MLAVAIGFFDGVHLGHRRILNGSDVAVTFSNHPLTVLNAAKAPRMIMSFEDRVAAIRACGVKDVVTLDFTPELASRSPEEFLAFLHTCLPSSSSFSYRCGANWRFGRYGAGSPNWLREHGIGVQVVESAEYEGETVSSTRIRECLLRGEIAAANAMMGRRYRVTGNVERGKGEGRKLGYPTVNLSVRASLLPLGVYQVELAGRRAIANFGLAPTFEDHAWKEPVLEVHLLEQIEVSGRNRCQISTESEVPSFTTASSPRFTVPSPGDRFSVEFVKFIRPERKFSSRYELQSQIAADIGDLV